MNIDELIRTSEMELSENQELIGTAIHASWMERNEKTDVDNRLWIQWGKEMVGRIKKVALTCIHHHV